MFHSATVYQERNEHDLLHDFADEVHGYLLNDRIRRALEDGNLDKQDLAGSLSKCYESLVLNTSCSRTWNYLLSQPEVERVVR